MAMDESELLSSQITIFTIPIYQPNTNTNTNNVIIPHEGKTPDQQGQQSIIIILFFLLRCFVFWIETYTNVLLPGAETTEL